MLSPIEVSEQNISVKTKQNQKAYKHDKQVLKHEAKNIFFRIGDIGSNFD